MTSEWSSHENKILQLQCQLKAGFMFQMFSFHLRIIGSGLSSTFLKNKGRSIIFL